jgi:tetratricopeptide (TPR) repeat protein
MRTNVYSFIYEGLMLLSLSILVFLIYSNTMGCPFIFDDVPNILDNPHIRLTSLTVEGMTKAGIESPSSNRPVANISFALNYFFHGYNIRGYHIVNILIHITTGIFLYVFAKTTLSIPSVRSMVGPPGWIPFFTVCIWLVHPIQTQSVTYIVQRMNSMAAMFYVMSFMLYAKARLAEEKRKRWALFAGCSLAGILALGSKEIAATLPFFIFLYEWYFFQELSWTWLRRHALRFAGLLAILAIMAIILLETDASQRKWSLYDIQKFTLPQRILTEFQVVIYYISLLIFPNHSRLNLDYDFPLSHSLFDPVTTFLSIVAIAGLLGLACYMTKKERLFSFCILWFLGNLVIESSVIPLALIYEHRTYLPSMLVGLMAVTLAYRYIRPKWLTVAVLCGMVMVYSVWTYQRNTVWSDDLIFWKDCVEKSPKKARPHNNLGNALKRQGRINEAVHHFSESLRLDPDYAKAHNNLGNALKSQGKLKEAMSHYLEALRIKPDYGDAHYNLGNAFKKLGKLEEAIDHYLEALRIKPHYAEVHNNLGNVMAMQGKMAEAIDHFSEALRIKPDFPLAHSNLGNALLSQGDLKEAISHYLESLRIRPDDAKAHFNLGVALARQGRLEEAITHYSEALRIKPGFPQAQRRLEHCLQLMGKSTGASNTAESP